MAVDTAPRLVDRRAPEAPVARNQTQPIVWWALIGGISLAVEAYVLIRWVSGPYFKAVPSGPSVLPTWMKVVLISWQAAGIVVALGVLYWFLVRPWRRDGRPTFDGLLCLGCFFVAWQDPLSSYFNHWYTYNSYLVNMGSWVKDVPGWMSYGAPGHMDVEPIIWTPFMYVYVFFAGAVLSCWVMRRASARWPRLGNLGLICCAVVVGMVFDFVVEGLLILPAGIYTYAGGHLTIFSSTYHKFPLTETVTAGGIWASLGALRFFKDDQGLTMVERGIDKLKVGSGRQTLLRFLAITGILNVFVLCLYNIPNGALGAHPTAWPRDIQKRSYLTDYLCGEGTDRACPGPTVPVSGGGRSAYVTTKGTLAIPGHGTIPKVVPFVH